MNNTKFQTLFFPLLLFITIVLVTNSIFAGNIDPNNDGSRYAWGENVGWINFNPSQGPGVTVTGTGLTGYAWGENIGWINLTPPGGGISNDGAGNLSGLAWAENVGWINFAGVKINPATGIFSGQTWGENIGWINFSIPNGAVKTSWMVKTDTTTTLQSNLNPSTFGQSVTFTATVTPGAATGTVAFKEGTTTLGDGTLSSGTATFSTSLLAAGSHSIAAEYAGDSNYNGSTSPALIQTVNKVTPTITWANPADIVYGTPLSATQLNATASVAGSFVYTPASGAVLNAGAGQNLRVDFTPTDTANYNTATRIVRINVLKVTTTTAISSSVNPSTFGQSVSFTATVMPGSATGAIQFKIDGSNFGTPVALSSGSGTSGATSLSVGNHAVTAVYSGDSNYITSTGTLSGGQTVNKATPTITWANPADIVYGTPLSATQLNATASVPGSFVYTPGAGTVLPAGSGQNLRADFTPTDTTNYNTATKTIQINVLKATTTTAVSSSVNPSTYGQSVTFTATVTPGSATGTTQFKIDGSNFGTPVALSSASGTSGATSLSVGNHAVTAVYSGDSNYITSTGTLSGGQTVNPVSQYTLSLTKVGSGSVMVNGTSHTLPWSGTFSSGSSVQLQAVPDTGWGFSSWSGDLVDSAISVSITMNSNKNVTATFNQSGWLTLDDDGDGIPNGEEQNTLHTDPSKKTLFVRPTTAGFNGSNFTNPQYWPYFVQNLFPAATSGYANIPAFTNAQIEIVVIGAGGHPYAPFNNYTYDPAQDCIDNPNGCFPNCTGSCTKRPHVDILEVTYVVNLNESLYSSLCTVTLCSNNSGHTFFDKRGGANTWSWDAKGYTPRMTSPTSNWGKYQYYAPEIFPFAIDNYIGEGAYRGSLSTPSGPGITTGNTPVGLTCTSDQCGCTTALCGSNTHNSSPMNLDDDGPVANPPDSTVEINGITYNVNMTIGSVTNSAQHYDRDKVLRRVIAHEMGHALLGASVDDHCQNEQCVMYDGTLNYDDLNFEGGCGHYDQIRLKIHNHTH